LTVDDIFLELNRFCLLLRRLSLVDAIGSVRYFGKVKRLLMCNAIVKSKLLEMIKNTKQNL